MKIKVQLVVCDDDGHKATFTGVAVLEKACQRKSILAFHREDEEDRPSSKCFGFVQPLDEKPKRCLFEVLKSQGHQMNQQLTFLSDGNDTVRDLQLSLNPQAEHLLDWFHLARQEAA